MPLIQQVLDKNPDNVKVVFKNFPLAMHKFARKAAVAALAAKAQGKYWEYHGKLVENFNSLTDEKLQQFATELGLDPEQFNNDLNNPDIQSLIMRDMRDGQQARVRGTPTIFVNGKLLRNRSFVGFQTMIDAEMTKSGGETADAESATEAVEGAGEEPKRDAVPQADEEANKPKEGAENVNAVQP